MKVALSLSQLLMFNVKKFTKREQYLKFAMIKQVKHLFLYMSRVMIKPTFWFLTWSDTNRAVQLQKMARDLKFRI